MKYYVTINNNSKHGYDLEIVNDNGKTVKTIELTKKTTDNYLYMPEECVKETNRRLVSIAMIQKSKKDRFEIEPREYREPRVLGSNSQTSKKPIYEWLEGDDKVTFIALLQKAQKIREEAAKKALTPVEKAKRTYERAQAAYEKALKEAQTENN